MKHSPNRHDGMTNKLSREEIERIDALAEKVSKTAAEKDTLFLYRYLSSELSSELIAAWPQHRDFMLAHLDAARMPYGEPVWPKGDLADD